MPSAAPTSHACRPRSPCRRGRRRPSVHRQRRRRSDRAHFYRRAGARWRRCRRHPGERRPRRRQITVREGTPERGHIREQGFDFTAGDLCSRPAAASARASVARRRHGLRRVAVRRRPRVAVLATGDELVPPGGSLGPGQIIASNHLGVAALAEATARRRACSASPAIPARASTRTSPRLPTPM